MVMEYLIERVSEDAETRQHVLILRRAESQDRLALNVQPREAVALGSLLADDGMPDTTVLEHLRNAASRGNGTVVGIRLLLNGDAAEAPALTPVLVMRDEDSPLEQAIPASIAHAAAWSVALNLPFEIDDELVGALRSVVAVIPGEPPSGFRDALAGLDEIDRL